MARFRMRGGDVFDNGGLPLWILAIGVFATIAAGIALIILEKSKDRDTQNTAGKVANTLAMILFVFTVVIIFVFAVSFF